MAVGGARIAGIGDEVGDKVGLLEADLAPQLHGAGDPEQHRPMVDTACLLGDPGGASRHLDEARVPQRLITHRLIDRPGRCLGPLV
jgi:hypothetical protein